MTGLRLWWQVSRASEPLFPAQRQRQQSRSVGLAGHNERVQRGYLQVRALRPYVVPKHHRGDCQTSHVFQEFSGLKELHDFIDLN
jgi:hypothetical protein